MRRRRSFYAARAHGFPPATPCNPKEEEQQAEKFTVTYALGDLVGDNAPAPSPQSVEKDSEVTLPQAPTYGDYVFNGWLPEGSTEAPLAAGSKFKVTKNITLTAQYGQPGDPVYDKLDPTNYKANFFTELYNVSRGIGNEKIAQGNDVAFTAELALGVGVRQGKSFNLGVKVQAIVDTTDGSDTAALLALTAGSKNIANIYFTAKDGMAYIKVADKGVKVNAKLVNLGDLLGSLLDADIPSVGSVSDVISKLADRTGTAFTLDVLMRSFGLSNYVCEAIEGAISGLKLEPFKVYGIFDLKTALYDSTIQNEFTVDPTTDNSYKAHVTGSLVKPMIADMLGAKTGIGDLDLAISFATDGNHNLTGNGVTISADLLVDKDNKDFASTYPAGHNPYLELSIKHLNLKDATGINIAPEDLQSYESELQFNVKEHFEFPGIVVAGNLLPKVDLNIAAKLDLVNEGDANTTQLRAYLATTTVTKALAPPEYSSYGYTDATPKHAFDLTYSGGRLALTIDKTSALIPAYADMTCIYGFVASPLGNMIQGLLESVDPAQAQEFANRYWTPVLDEEGKETGKTWNNNFKALVIDHLNVSDIFGLLIKKDDTATTSAEDPAPTYTVKTPGVFNGILKIFSLLRDDENKLTIGAKRLLPTICEVANYFGLGSDLTPDSALTAVKDLINSTSFSIVTTALTFEGGKGGDFVPRLQWLLLRDEQTAYADDKYTAEEDDLKLSFYLTENAIKWDLTWYGAKGEPAANGENRNVGIVYNSEISLDTPVNIEKFDLTEYETAKRAYDEGIADAKATLARAQKAFDDADADLTAKTAPYEATQEYKDYQDAVAEYNDAKAAISPNTAGSLWNELKQADGAIGGAYFNKTLGVVNGYTENGLWRLGATVANNRNYRFYQGGSYHYWTSPLLEWVEAGKRADGAEREKLDSIIDAIQKLVEDNANLKPEVKTRYKDAIEIGGELFDAILRECEAAIDQDKKDTANKATSEYQAWKAASDTQITKQSELTAAQKAVAALEDPYFAYYYWDLKAAA